MKSQLNSDTNLDVTLAFDDGKPNKAHKSEKFFEHIKMGMENEDVMAIVLQEIDIIRKEQVMLIKYHDQLEDRRKRFEEFVRNTDKLEISEGARENLVQNVSYMELTVSKCQTIKDKKDKSKKKCRYDNRGYCKYLEKCKYQHSKHICDQYQKSGKCGAGECCQLRHPQVCKFWKQDTQGCKRDQGCKYMHQNPATNTKSSKEEEKEVSNVDLVDKTIEMSDSEIENDLETNETAQKIIELEALIALKNKEITELKEIEDKLKMENEKTKEQAEKNKRVASNIYKELVDLKSRK